MTNLPSVPAPNQFVPTRPIIDVTQLAPVATPEELAAVYARNFGALYEDFGQAFRRIGMNNGIFSLIEGESREDIQAPLTFLLLAAGDDDHCTLYPRPYTQGDPNPPKPYAIWHWKNGFPSYLPGHLAERNPATGKFWYKRARRLAVVVARPDAQRGFDIDWNTIYSFELGSSSLYGKDVVGQTEARSFSSLVTHFKRNSWHIGYMLLQAIQVPVSSARFYHLLVNGQAQYIPPEAQQRVYQLMASPEVRAAVDVQDIVPTEPLPAFLMANAAMQQYQQAPAQQYAQAPAQQYAQAPAQQYAQAPAQQYAQAPAQQYAQAPAQQAPAQQIMPAQQTTPMVHNGSWSDPTPQVANAAQTAAAAAALAQAELLSAEIAAAVPPAGPATDPTPQVANATQTAAAAAALTQAEAAAAAAKAAVATAAADAAGFGASPAALSEPVDINVAPNAPASAAEINKALEELQSGL